MTTIDYNKWGVCVDTEEYAFSLTPQHAYELHQALSAILPRLPQPFHQVTIESSREPSTVTAISFDPKKAPDERP